MSILEFVPPVPGRQVSLSVLHGQKAPTTRVSFRINDLDPQGRLATGVDKLAQNVLITLFTPDGLTPYPSVPGTALMQRLISGQLRTVLEVRQVFAQARDLILAYFQQLAINFPETPLDEQLADLELIAVRREGDAAVMTLRITNQTAAQQQLTSFLRLDNGL